MPYPVAACRASKALAAAIAAVSLAYRSTTTLADQTGATFSVNKPSGVVDGDGLRAIQITSLGLGGTAPTAPSGWTQEQRQTFNVGSIDLVVWKKTASSEGASWTFNNATGGMSPTSSVRVVAVSGPPNATPDGGNVGSGTGTTATPGAYTTGVANTLVFGVWGVGSTAGETITPHASFTPLGTVGGSSCKFNCGYKAQAAAGAVSNMGATLSGSLVWGAIIFGLKG